MNDRHTLHPLDAALQLRWQEEGLVGLATDANYWNTAGPFGGWLLAAGIKAVLTDPRAKGTPVEAHARFLAAPKSGELELRIDLQSQGRSVGFWHVAIWQHQARGPRLCAEISVILAEERETAHLTAAVMPKAPHPDTLHTADTRRSSLSWLRRYDFRYVYGAPFKMRVGEPNAARLESLLWIRDADGRAHDWIGLAAFADVPAPRPFLIQHDPSPVATVSLSLYFHADEGTVRAAGAWLLLKITGKTMGRGFFDHAVEIWSGEGTLLASSTQLAWFSSGVAAAIPKAIP